MTDIFWDPDSPFYHSAAALPVGEIPGDDFYRFAVAKFKAGGRKLPRKSFDSIGGKGVYSGSFITNAQVSGVGTMRRSMAKLIAEKLIYRYNDEYKFFNPFFAQWLGRGRRPLRSASPLPSATYPSKPQAVFSACAMLKRRWRGNMI